jgi:hypothetical protein
MMRRVLGIVLLTAIGFAPTRSAQGITLYAADLVCPCLFTIDTSDFTLYAVYRYTLPHDEAALGGLCFDQAGTMYGLSLGDNSALYIVGTTTPDLTLVGRLNVGFVGGGGLAFDRTTGVLYAINVRTLEGTELLVIDRSTGAGRLLGIIGGGERHVFQGLAFDEGGQLYAMDLTTNALWRIDKNDPSSAATVQVGTGFGSGIDLGHGGGMTNDADNGVYYGVAAGKLFTIDLTTGLGTVLYDYGAYPAFVSLAYRGEYRTPVLPVGWGALKVRYR